MDQRNSKIDKPLKIGMSRRDFSKVTLITLGAGTLAACAPQAVVPGAAVSTGPLKELLDSVSQSAKDADPIILAIWAWRPEVVEGFVQRFNEDYEENLQLNVLPGDYNAAMEARFISRAPTDLFYAMGDMAGRWGTANWISDIGEYWDHDEVKAQLLPQISEGFSTRDGKLQGLPYYGGASGVILSNEIMLEEAGLTGQYPETYDGMWDQCRELKRMGIADHPFLPRWMPNFVGLPQSFDNYLYAEGEDLVDEDGYPVYDIGSSSIAYKVLDTMRGLTVDELIPPEVLTWQETEILDAFYTGRYVYMQHADYGIRAANDPEKSAIAGHVLFVPPTDKQRGWGSDVSAVYAISSQERSREKLARVLRAVEFLGRHDKDGLPYVAKTWFKEEGLHNGYKGFLNEPETQSSMSEWSPIPVPEMASMLEGVIANSPVLPVMKTWWRSETLPASVENLSACLAGEISVPDALKGIKEAQQMAADKWTPRTQRLLATFA